MGAPLSVVERDGAVTFEVRVKPRSSKDAIVGVVEGRLEVALRAPPVEGAANDALVRMLAVELGVSKRSVEIVRGHKGRKKLVRVEGVTRALVEDRCEREG